ncbi:efflux RND transporter permease subunit [Mucisphaera sp.]|uniref:efflux RND transporter permease subunit n=1 Tax=Mucisphaera sp. TaxID=2913024 RepID=UPI003D13D291
MAHNSIAANLIMVLLLAGGLWSAVSIQKEVFPEFELDVVNVRVGYPGAAPTEVEQGILRPIEDAIRGVDGISELTSQASEGSGSVSIELVAGAERMKAFQDIEQAVSRIRTFPDDIDQPQVQLQSRQREVIEIGLFGSVDIWVLRQLGEQLRDQLLAHPKITQVELSRVRDYVTHIEIPRNRLREYNLTLDDVAQLIESSAEDVAAGAVDTSGGEILLRVKARKQWAQEFANIELLANEAGAVLRLGDIASITDGFEEGGFPSQFNQTPAIEVNIFRVGNQSPLEVADAVVNVMAAYETTLPPGVSWRINGNAAEEFGRRLSLVVENGLLAVVIVLLILALFLEFRLAFWVMMGMTVSFIGGIMFLPIAGVSINMISLFGFLMVLGIVVDDAIVIGENIYEHRQSETDRLKAAIKGAREMAAPVTFSILSNVIAFIPLMFIPGETGKFWGPLPIVVIIVLLVSLFEALFILPAHLAHSRTPASGPGIQGRLHSGQQIFSKWFTRIVETIYRPFLRICLSFRYVTATAALTLFLIAGGYALSAHMGMILMPVVSAHEIEAGVRLPVGTTTDQAAEIANCVTEASMRMFQEHDLHQVADGIKTNVRGGSFVDVEIVMKPPDQRDMTANQVIALWRDSIGDLPGVDQITFEAEAGPGGWRQDISIDLSHADIDILEAATKALVQRLESFDNTRDVSDNYNRGKQQLDFELLLEGRALGLTPEEVGRQLRGAYFGSLALRLMRGTNEVEVRVKLPENEREDLHHLESLIIRTPSGAEVPLIDVVRVVPGEAFSSINRRDGRRIVNVSMDVEPKRAVNQVISALRNEELPELRQNFPGITWTFEGSDAEMRDATAKLWGGFGLALGVIYALLAVAFRSYVQPLIVLVAIPFGMIGAVIGHILLGYDLSLISFMGVIALSGVVVNDSLIMVDHANRHRGHQNAFDAICDAGVRRFRPIVLTTATTFGGLTPIIMETSLQAQYIIPMAISLGFGIVFATTIILLLVPCLYMILEDVSSLAHGNNKHSAATHQ